MKTLRASLAMMAIMTVLLGGLYPASVWLFAQTLAPAQANGSLLYENGEVVGSALIGQTFSSPHYFHGRPSATHGGPYQFLASGGSQLSPANPLLIETVKGRLQNFHKTEGRNKTAPIDFVTSSASGLDPDISLQAARVQAERIAKARGLSPDVVHALIDRHTKSRTLGFLGEPRVNVLRLNLELDHTGKAR